MSAAHRTALAVFATLCCFCVVQAVNRVHQTCSPRFSHDTYHAVVPHHVNSDAVLAKLEFSACGRDGKSALLEAGDPRFKVAPDGTVRAAQQLHLKAGVTAFEVTAQDPVMGQTLRTVVQLQTRMHRHKQNETLVLKPWSRDSGSLHQRRYKRAWVIPPIRITENNRERLPQQLVQIKSDKVQSGVHYSITGPGADQPPIGLFTIQASTGWLFVNRILDREEKDMYWLKGYAVDSNGNNLEEPVDLQILVIDQNDNRPQFDAAVYHGSVPEGSLPGTSVMDVIATDKDDPTQDGGILKYKILSQDPPNPVMFTINEATGNIRTIASGLDREVTNMYSLIVQASDGHGDVGLSATATAIIMVTDANDNPPVFDPTSYNCRVKENAVGIECTTLTVTDKDDPDSKAWAAVYYAVSGNESGNFQITKDEASNDGIVTVIKGLDYEKTKQVTLVVRAENEVPLMTNNKLSTATVTVTVEDVNEAPEFTPPVKKASILENLPVGQVVAVMSAKDPDRDMAQKISYSIYNDPMGWLTVDADSGTVTTVVQLDREAVDKSVYTATFLAKDNGSPPATGTGTLLLTLQDVNDNAPVLSVPQSSVCASRILEPINLTVFDADVPPNTGPYQFKLMMPPGQPNIWTLTQHGDYAVLTSKKENLPQNDYNISVSITDNGSPPLGRVSELLLKVCDCNELGVCKAERVAAGLSTGAIVGVLAAILLLLLLLLLFLLYRRKGQQKVVKVYSQDELRDNLIKYDEEGGGEEDQKYDASQLPYLLGEEMPIARPTMVMRYDQMPEGERPRFPARPPRDGSAEPNMSGFIDDSLKAADGDPTAPPFDTLLVFDFEGEGSVAGSVSTINTASSDADQDYKFLDNWGPRFQKLADMYGGTE